MLSVACHLIVAWFCEWAWSHPSTDGHGSVVEFSSVTSSAWGQHCSYHQRHEELAIVRVCHWYRAVTDDARSNVFAITVVYHVQTADPGMYNYTAPDLLQFTPMHVRTAASAQIYLLLIASNRLWSGHEEHGKPYINELIAHCWITIYWISEKALDCRLNIYRHHNIHYWYLCTNRLKLLGLGSKSSVCWRSLSPPQWPVI